MGTTSRAREPTDKDRDSRAYTETQTHTRTLILRSVQVAQDMVGWKDALLAVSVSVCVGNLKRHKRHLGLGSSVILSKTGASKGARSSPKRCEPACDDVVEFGWAKGLGAKKKRREEVRTEVGVCCRGEECHDVLNANSLDLEHDPKRIASRKCVRNFKRCNSGASWYRAIMTHGIGNIP